MTTNSTDRPAYVAPRWIPTKDVAKLVRAYLKREHPGVKFSVRSDSYSGGSAVRVRVPYLWTRQQERALWEVLSPWGSTGFDGMTDSSYGKSHALCPTHGVTLTAVDAHWGTEGYVGDMCCGKAEPVHMGASYVSVQRDWQRPAGITRADDVRKGDNVEGWTVADVARDFVHSDGDKIKITFTDRPPLTLPGDAILTRS